MNSVIEVIDAHMELAEKQLLIIEHISIPQGLADKLSEEVFGLVSGDMNQLATSTIKTYRNIPIRIVDNTTLKVCYSVNSFF